ncbi:hypothetical protein GGP79_003175 [Salinibacter ruber]|uniref:PEGA domain-containing protein n=1 Tax=Salinibacter ruber TaxID=146919 RepID=UPI00216A2025|nr:hypothetical protein [Salinibacter ruber]
MRYFVLLLSVSLVGCATIVTGSSTDISLQSDPSEAQIEINSQDRGETPTTLSLDSDRSYTVELSLEGYEDESIQLRKSTSGWVAGNLLFGGIPGLVIDAATGGLYVLSPKNVSADLDEETADASDELTIRVAMNVDTSWKKVGQLDPLEK